MDERQTTYRQQHIATEQRSFEDVIASLPGQKSSAEAVFARVLRVGVMPRDARILDIGASAGGFLVACQEFGYHADGIEPWDEAREMSKRLAEHVGSPIRIEPGVAESIPFPDSSFDVVHASSVIEHVLDVEKAFSEIQRVLKPGGAFWFNAASAMCPRQPEIRKFPLFGWYPNWVKLRIMNWVKDAKPHLVGHTRTPAIHWFTPRKARRLLREAGFSKVYDRWDIRGEDEGGNLYKLALGIIRSSRLTKNVADVLVAGCSYLAVK